MEKDKRIKAWVASTAIYDVAAVFRLSFSATLKIPNKLLLTTQLDIVDVSRSVGYISHSRFSALFKRYRGIYSKEVRHLASKKQPIICPYNEEARERC